MFININMKEIALKFKWRWSRVFYRKAVPSKAAGLAWRVTLLKKDVIVSVFIWILRNFLKILFWDHLFSIYEKFIEKPIPFTPW